MSTEEQYLAVRHVVQYILVPVIFVIGFVGNAVSIIVLTRKRMRCSTNIYLTGLAVADIVYLTMLLIMSAEHYKSTKEIAIFWRCRGLFQWLIDGSSYISLYIVVCFTIERYIAVCHPMKGQVFCTEERAKKVLAIVVIVILLSILSANFEFELEENVNYVNITNGQPCNNIDEKLLYSSSTPKSLSLNNNNETEEFSLIKNHNNLSNINKNYSQSSLRDALSAITTTTTTIKTNIPADDQYYYDMKEDIRSTLASSAALRKFGNNSTINEENGNSKRIIPIAENFKDIRIMSLTSGTVTTSTTTTIATATAAAVNNSSNGCRYVKTYRTIESALAHNRTYRTVFDMFTIVFYSIVPLILIIIFNTFLIRAVQKSNRLREHMTNQMSVRQMKQQQQENKITIILIAVVILFIICQTPWAIYLFLASYTNLLEDKYLPRTLGNIFNTLVAIDAASNFILYCALSDKYRKTLKELIMGYKYKGQDTSFSRQDTLASSWYNYRYKSFKRQPSELNGNNNSRSSRNQRNERKSINVQNSSSSQQQSPLTPSASLVHQQAFYPSSSQSQPQTPSADKNTVNNSYTGMTSSFCHKLPNNDKRPQLRQTVSFHNQPLSSPSSSSSVSTFITSQQNQENQQQNNQKEIEEKTTMPEVIIRPTNDDSGNGNGNGKILRDDSITTSACDNDGINVNFTSFLKPSDSSGSLTRSQSLILQPKTKHSPDCPKFDGNF